ncbi:hypothetical protein AOLI_G00141780 [Acnodon oligacanthus]
MFTCQLCSKPKLCPVTEVLSHDDNSRPTFLAADELEFSFSILIHPLRSKHDVSALLDWHSRWRTRRTSLQKCSVFVELH